jgi:hypothetical protein
MPSPLPDYIPTVLREASPAPSRRGGRRPGAGAPRGNLNALRHGRRSRFRDLLATESDAVALAGRMVARERRVAERHAATLLRLALIARHRRDYADAVEQGRPLPPLPLIDLALTPPNNQTINQPPPLPAEFTAPPTPAFPDSLPP